ncbi:MAG: CDP-alcohol phosphatidyltransferase family protein [Gemmatimonadetes bacterium]|nr:CDP-alcohol phosphatidyltransferase family protein [Gemmatimonadota bacterium]
MARSRYWNSANAVSALRLPLALAFLAAETPVLRVLILAAAAASDYLDGWIARRFGQRTRAGEILDPLADKVFVLVALASFARSGVLQIWELLVLLARDLFAAAASISVLLGRLPVRLRARWGGKIVTGLQILAVLVLMARPQWIEAVVLVTGVAGLYAIGDYIRAGLLALRARSRAR